MYNLAAHLIGNFTPTLGKILLRNLQAQVQSLPCNLPEKKCVSGCVLLYHHCAGPSRRPLTPYRYGPAKGQQRHLKPKGRILPPALFSSPLSRVVTAGSTVNMNFLPSKRKLGWDVTPVTGAPAHIPGHSMVSCQSQLPRCTDIEDVAQFSCFSLPISLPSLYLMTLQDLRLFRKEAWI